MVRFFKDRKGYKHFADSGEPVHRYVAERKLGWELRPGEVVHHINRDKSDNRRSNLWVFPSQDDHDATHRRDKKRYNKW